MSMTLQERQCICELNQRVLDLEEGGGGGGGGDVTLGGSNTFTGANIFTQPVKFADGTAAAPSITFASAPTSGVYNAGGGTLAFAQAGNLAGYFAGNGTFTLPTYRFAAAGNGAENAPIVHLAGAIFTGGTATSTKPHLLIEPAGATSTGWSTLGTMLGLNAAAGFTGNLIDAQVNGVSQFKVGATGGIITTGYLLTGGAIQIEATSTLGWGGDLFMYRKGAQNLQLGYIPSATPLANTLTIGEASRPGTDSNVAGASGTIQSGLGTGTGAASVLIFQTPTVAASGSATQTYTTRLTLNSAQAICSGQVVSGGNLYTTANGSVLQSIANGRWLMTDAALTDFSRLQLGGTTASFPAIKRNATDIHFRLADDTAFCSLVALGVTTYDTTYMCKTGAALANGAAAATATMTNGPTAGNPTKWIKINDNGTTRHIPAW